MRNLLLSILFFLLSAGYIEADELTDKFVTAAAKGELSKVMAYVKKGVNIDQKNQARWTALAYACKYNHPEIVKFLVENGANINETVNTGSTPLAVALLSGNFDIADYLIKKKADVNKPDIMGMTPLMWAAKDGNLKVVKYLLENGSNVNAQNNNSRSVLEVTINSDVKDFLRSKGAKTSQELMN